MHCAYWYFKVPHFRKLCCANFSKSEKCLPISRFYLTCKSSTCEHLDLEHGRARYFCSKNPSVLRSCQRIGIFANYLCQDFILFALDTIFSAWCQHSLCPCVCMPAIFSHTLNSVFEISRKLKFLEDMRTICEALRFYCLRRCVLVTYTGQKLFCCEASFFYHAV